MGDEYASFGRMTADYCKRKTAVINKLLMS